jgi:transposase
VSTTLSEFRQQIIELARAGRTPAELSREFGPTAQSIANWIAQDARDRGKPVPGKEGLTTAEREELVRLRRRLRQVEQERDILAKATAWFAGKSEKTSTPSTNS